jgi:hypothetical protein
MAQSAFSYVDAIFTTHAPLAGTERITFSGWSYNRYMWHHCEINVVLLASGSVQLIFNYSVHCRMIWGGDQKSADKDSREYIKGLCEETSPAFSWTT